MTKDELIAKQQIEIEELKKTCKEQLLTIVSIGGCASNAIKDNKLGYTNKQLAPLFEIEAIADNI